jgi:hypothetical protein
MKPRRRFLRALAAAPLVPSALLAAEPTALPAAPAPPSPAPSPGATPPSPAAEALGQVVRHRYGSQLEPPDLAEIDKAIEGNLQAADRLKDAFKLGNADEPVTVFEARLRPAGRRSAPARTLARG